MILFINIVGRIWLSLLSYYQSLIFRPQTEDDYLEYEIQPAADWSELAPNDYGQFQISEEAPMPIRGDLLTLKRKRAGQWEQKRAREPNAAYWKRFKMDLTKRNGKSNSDSEITYWKRFKIDLTK